MPNYQFQLELKHTEAAREEWVIASDDEDALALAEIRLLMGSAFTRVTVRRPGMEPIVLRRDRPPGPHSHSPRQDRSPSTP